MSLKEALDIQQNYFKEYGQEISKRNLKLMQTVCYAGIILYIGYYLITFLFFRDKMIAPVFAIMILIFALFLYQIKKLLKGESLSMKRTQMITLFMLIVLMVYTILMSTVSHPELQAVYYPLFLLLGPVMFILPVHQQLLVNGISFFIFCGMECFFKAKSLWTHDLFESFTSLVFSFVMIFLMTQFRVQGETLKDHYYRLSREDGLTGLLNKTTGTELAKTYIESKTVKENFSLILLDIDDFKHINDTYGHDKGDEILEKAGELLISEFRKEDIVTRFGGDEFMIVLKKVTKQETEGKLIDLKEQIRIIEELEFTCSMGVVLGTCGIESYTNIMNIADDLMYQAKKNGKNQFLINDRR